MLIWTLAVRLIVVVIGSSQRVSQLSERVARIDLLDLRGLAPLARIGLRSALAFALAGTAALAEGRESAEDATRLGGLLALEARIAEVGEWPFDVGTFVRFAVFLALPLGSWIAGALVEWVVTRVLG